MATPTLTAADAAARLGPTDTLGIPLGPGQPAGLPPRPRRARRLGRPHHRSAPSSSTSTRCSSTRASTTSSGFFGPAERFLRDSGADIQFVPARLPALRARCSSAPGPRVMATVATPPDADGWCSLSLHAGATVGELRRAGADPERLLVVEVNAKLPRTFGVEPEYRHALHVDEVDVLVESDRDPFVLADAAPTTRWPRPSPSRCSPSCPTAPPSRPASAASPRCVAALLAEGDGGDYGIHSEMFTTGLMRPAPGRQGHQRPQGHLRRVLGHDVRRRHRRALRVARRQRRRALPARRPGQLRPR